MTSPHAETDAARTGADQPPPAWEAAGAPPALRREDVHVWWARLDAPGGRGEATLSQAERGRARQLMGERERLRWISSRAQLRAVLALYLRCEPGEVPLASTPSGKPELDAGGTGLCFNVSHSGAEALYAVGFDELGLDIELVRPRPRMPAIARRLLGADELARVQDLAPRERELALLRAWVRREAAVKCIGVGLAGMGFGARPDERERADAAIAELWVDDLPPLPRVNAVAALARRRRPSELCCVRWTAPGG